MGNTIIFESFAQKIIKKIQHLAFTDKVKLIKTYVPEKVKLFIENSFVEEQNTFKKNIHLNSRFYQMKNS